MNRKLIFEFNADSDLSHWKVVNDAVMGGKSKSQFHLNTEGNGTFEGAVSLENNGGFCSVKYVFEPITLEKSTFISIRLKGDGKIYQFRVKSNTSDSHSYVYHFQTNADWQTIEIPINELYPAFRGQKLNMPNYNGSHLEEIAFLIGNKKEEQFQLVLDRIEAK
jgi:hypothetical protein